MVQFSNFGRVGDFLRHFAKVPKCNFAKVGMQSESEFEGLASCIYKIIS